MEKIMDSGEIQMLAITFEIVNAWAEQWIAVHDGEKTMEQAFNDYNEYLVPVGQMLALALSLPGVEAQLADLLEKHTEA